MLIIAGGKGDPDLNWISSAAEHRGYEYVFSYCNSSCSTPVEWDIQKNVLTLDGKEINPSESSIYIRYSMFDNYGEQSRDDCALLVEHWYQTMRGWAMANEAVGLLNRDAHVLNINKPYNLILAQKSGLRIPLSSVVNQIEKREFDSADNKIAKVVGDGESTRMLEDRINESKNNKVCSSRPWIVQEKLNYPELRVFRIGEWLFGFEMLSDHLDHRLDENLKLDHKDVPDALVEPVRAFTDALKLDFCAIDFKTCPETGEYVFLEVNSAPTFSGYDAKVSGRLSDAIILHLQKRTGR